MSLLAEYRVLWNAAVVQRHPQQLAWAVRTGTVAALLLGGLSALQTRDWILSLKVGCFIPLAMLVCFLVFSFVPGATLLNTPANARLVPGMRRRLMQMTALAWLVTSVAPALVLGTTAASTMLWFAGAATWCIGFGLARGGYWMGGQLPTIVVLCGINFRENFQSFSSLALAALAIVLVTAMGAIAITAIFPRSGERHWRQRGRMERVGERDQHERPFGRGTGPQVRSRLYRWALQRDYVGGKSGGLLLHVLGPASHWTQLCLQLGVLLAAALLAKFLMPGFASTDTLGTVARIGWMFSTALMLLQIFDLERLAARLAATGGEQSLLRLAAHSAPASRFNRQLGRALLRYALLNWAMIAATALCLAALSGASVDILLMQACLCCLGLPLVAVPLRDYARSPGMMGWWLGAVGAGAGLFSGAAGLFAFRALGLPGWPVMALASGALAVLAVGWRWRAMVAAPVAFPVGRLA